MARKKILWLVSWYPNRSDRFDGDFIQRHARAAALFNDIHVIFVTDASSEENIEEEWHEENGLTERIIYFKKEKGIFKKILKQLTWRKLYLNAVKDYIKKNGKPEWVHVHVPWKAGLIALWMKRKYNIPFIVTEHWGIYNDVVRDNIQTRPPLVKRLLKRIFSEAEIFTSVSKFLAERINAMIIKKDAVIIPNVVDTSLFNFSGKENPAFRFIHVSNMVPLKNVKGILEAAKILMDDGENFEVIMAGNKNNEYEKLVNEMNLSVTVFFRGEISYSQVAKEMQMADVFVLFSDMENSPCVIAEALCCGLPVIATNIGGVPELINDGTDGTLITPRNTKMLAESMKNIIHNYHYDHKKISQRSIDRFNYEFVGKMLDEVYSKRQ